MTKSHSLKRNEILRLKKDIDAFFVKGKQHSEILRFNSLLLKIIQNKTESDSKIRVAFSVSKRCAPKAHTRNYIKRLLRENYRLQKTNIELMGEGMEVHFFFIFNGSPFINNSDVKSMVIHLLRGLPKKFPSLIAYHDAEQTE